MYVKPRVTDAPALDGHRRMDAVVVLREVVLQVVWHVGFDAAQEFQKLAAAMVPVQLADHGSDGDIPCGKQRCGAMAYSRARAARGCRGQRQDRLGAVKRLNLALLVHAAPWL